jgi:ribonuclease BN (tRNA processing enzyme)
VSDIQNLNSIDSYKLIRSLGDFLKTEVKVSEENIETKNEKGSGIGWVLTERSSGEQMGKRRIVISDTRPTETILNAAKGADLLVHEATYPDTNALTAHKHRHCTVTEAANLAVKAHVGALALTHTGSRYSKQNILKEAGKIFPLVLVPSPLDRI